MSWIGRWCGVSPLVVALACGGAAPPVVPSAAPPAPASERDPSPLTTDVIELPRPITSFGAAAHHGALYLYGGYFGTPHAYAREGQSGDLVRLDVAARSASTLHSGEGVQGAQLASEGDVLVRVGGMRADNAEGAPEQLASLRDVARWTGSAWQPLAPLPEARSSHGAVLRDGKLYVFGGWILSGPRATGRFADAGFELDLAKGTYRTIPQPFRARAVGVGHLGKYLAVVGGLDDQAKAQRAVHLFDPATGTWTRGPDFPGEPFGVAVTSSSRGLIASGKDGLVYLLGAGESAFRPVAALAFPRFFHQLAMLDDARVAVLGGINGMSRSARVSHVEVIDLNDPGPRVLRFSLTSPSPGKNRQGVGLIGGELVVFGGNRSLGQHDFAPDDFRREAFALELSTMRTRPLADFPVARQTVQTVTMDGKLLALGGFGHDGDKARAHADAFLFDPQGGVFAPSNAVLPSPRTQFGLAARGDALWIFGGLDYDPSRPEAERFVHPTRVLHAEKGQPFAQSALELPRPRRAFGGALLGDQYVLVGGMADGFQPVLECDAYDFAAGRWSSLACPAPRISPQLVALDDKLYLAGGSTPGQGELAPDPRLEVFDPAAGEWSVLLPEIPLEPRHLTMVPYERALLLYSAHRDDGTIQVALVVPPVASRAAPSVTTATALRP